MFTVGYTVDSIFPKKIVFASDGVKNADKLLKEKSLFNVIGKSSDDCYLPGKSSIVLDFGKEYSGRVRFIVSTVGSREGVPLHIRLGESLGEVNSFLGEFNSTNDHNVRDSIFNVKFLSDQTYSRSGFRFVRIDNDSDLFVNFRAIVLNFEHINSPISASFSCEDKILNNIFSVAARTAYLCIENGYLIDGIKRDGLVWAGDMFVQIRTLLLTVGAIEPIKRTLLDTMINYPKNEWMNFMPTYSIWWTLSCLSYYTFTDDKDFFNQVKGRIKLILKQINLTINDDTSLDFKKKGLPTTVSMPTFISWFDYGKEDEDKAWYSLVKYTVDLLKPYFKKDSIYISLSKKLKEIKIKKTSSKSFHALNVLAYSKGDAEIFKSRIKKENTTFLTYMVYKAMARLNLHQYALESMKSYYGNMLKLNATTFFEEFDPSWKGGTITTDKIKDEPYFHASYGKECYIGYRLSLCHAWSSGPAPFLIEDILGVNFKNSRTISIKPNCCGLKNIDAEFMTYYGLVKIRITNGIVKILSKPSAVKIN